MGYAHVNGTTILKMGIIDLGTNELRIAVEELHKLFTTGGAFEWVKSEPNISIVMESQPTHGAPKTISHCIQLFCLMNNIACEFMSPNDKLKVIKQWYDSMPKTTRAERKIISMKVCSALLQLPENKHLSDFYTSHQYKQRTDLADAVVQGVRCLQRRKKSPITQYLLEHIPVLSETPAVQQQVVIDASDQKKRAHDDEFVLDNKKRPCVAEKEKESVDFN
jgi:hypothetical protein